MLGSFFWGIACITCCFVGAYLYCDHDSKFWSTVSMVLGIILLFVTIFSSTFSAIEDTSNTYEKIVEEKEAQIFLLENKSSYMKNDEIDTISGCYKHKAAELMSSDLMPDGTYQNVFIVEENETQAFIWVSDNQYADVPYLLTMDDMDTQNDPTDDVILVVWACME